MGRLAMCSDNRQKARESAHMLSVPFILGSAQTPCWLIPGWPLQVKLAFEAQEEASLALACDPNNDLAHHLQGRWHYEMV